MSDWCSLPASPLCSRDIPSPLSPGVIVVEGRCRHLPQHRLYFFPLLHGHGALRPVPGYFSSCRSSAVSWESSRGILGNISWCRAIIGAMTDCRKSANSAATIWSAGCISARPSACSASGRTAVGALINDYGASLHGVLRTCFSISALSLRARLASTDARYTCPIAQTELIASCPLRLPRFFLQGLHPSPFILPLSPWPSFLRPPLQIPQLPLAIPIHPSPAH